jgi:hypothetical protein
MDQPFAALEAHARGLNVDAMDSMEYSHVPYVVLLVRAGCQWKDEVGHGKGLPVARALMESALSTAASCHRVTRTRPSSRADCERRREKEMRRITTRH